MNALVRLVCLLVLVGGAIDTAAEPVDIDRGLILYYAFDQEGEYVEDLSGHGRYGVINGATWVPDGVSGGAMYLGGRQHSIETSDAGFPEGDAHRSFSWWFAIDELRPDFSTDFMHYGTLSYNQANVLSLDWRLQRDCPAFTQWGGVYLSGRRIDQVLTWYHLVFTYAGNGRYTYYVNGERWHGHSELRGPINTRLGGVFGIGSCRPSEVNSLGGFIDEVRVYDRALADAEVSSLFLQGASRAGQPVAARSVQLAAAVADTTPSVTEHAASESIQRKTAHQKLVQQIQRAQEASPSSMDPVESIEYPFSTPHVLTVGFSDHAEGEQDVTVFYPDETLHVRVADVDLALWHPRLSFSLTLHQLAGDGGASVAETIILEADESHVFYGEISLAPFQAGTVLVNLVALDEEAERIVFMRSAWIIIKDSP